MDAKQAAREVIAAQRERYPACETADLIKALHQSAMGCGHFAGDPQRVLAYLCEEIKTCRVPKSGRPLVEPIGRRFARVHLAPFAQTGMRAETLAALFTLSSREAGSIEELHAALEALCEMDGTPETRALVEDYRAQGCPAQHHSETFRAHYAPAYRVIRREYAQLLPLFARIDALLCEKNRVCMAIEGGSATGKTTLAALMRDVYGACVLHMDDFFLRGEQRTPQRFAQPGGNVDYERFAAQVLPYLHGEGAFDYIAYDCHMQAMRPAVRLTPGALVVVEGAYAMHPAFGEPYDLHVLLSCSAQTQDARIRRRNTPEMYRRFKEEWIPLEQRYFDATRPQERCDMLLSVTDGPDGAVWEVLREAKK